MTRVSLVGVRKIFGKTVAVDRVSIDIEDGELFTIVGPSGCGKTTLLRIIAGFEMPDEGRVFFDDKDVTRLKPSQRNTAMVFQNYALWPHMTVFENIAYGLKLRKLPKEEIKSRVMQVVELVRLEGLENRYPLQLSGGQQQRVALARALVVEPKVLLLDEPLSNLDAKLRIEMREEIKRLQKMLGITTIYVTHDQEEAMSISDRIAVMDKGRILQVGKPRDIYFYPKNIFVASFVGRSNILEGVVVDKKGEVAEVVISSGKKLRGVVASDRYVEKGEKVAVVIRPEAFTMQPPSTDYNIIEGSVEITMFQGDKVNVKLRAKEYTYTIYLEPETDIPPGTYLSLYVPVSKTRVMPLA